MAEKWPVLITMGMTCTLISGGKKQCLKGMAEFVCSRCGKCCISLGRHITIERSLSPVQHYCRIGITGDILPVTIGPAHRELYVSGQQDPGWCPFLRKTPSNTFSCTIYDTRPAICREFRCRTMIIRDQDGKEAGHAAGKSLSTSDTRLVELWEELKGSSPEQMIRELSCHGYRAELLS
jgi:Fe-S-cluster containining protein